MPFSLPHWIPRLVERHPRRSRPRRRTFHYEHVLGTSFELTVVATGTTAAQRAESVALAEVDRLEAILSGWSSNSELARWTSTHDVDVSISPELVEVLEASDGWRVRTSGAFDPAAQAIIALLRDGAGDRSTHDALRVLLESLHGARWLVDGSARTARRLTTHPISIDAIAKGYIVTRAAALARAVDGVSDALLNVGGDVQHFGMRPVAVGVANPFAPAENTTPLAVVRLRNAAIATSGGYRRGFIANGRRVSHIVDPRTGQPTERIASASVFAPDCATADALSTAFSVLAPQESVVLADSLAEVGCLLVERDGTVTTNATWNACAVAPRHVSSEESIDARYA
ncbi:MAG: FAD:protein FMN transferase [Gemmatimonadaceae bacterium]|jgi:thiamine biosynthesis lipoprotein